MIPNAYLYVITERYPKSGTLRLNENMPQFICQTEDEAKFIIEDLKRLADISFAVFMSERSGGAQRAGASL